MAHVKRELRHNRLVRWTDGLGNVRSASLAPDQARALIELAEHPVYEPGRPPVPTAAILEAVVHARRNIAETTRLLLLRFLERRVVGTALGEHDFRSLNLRVTQRWLDQTIQARLVPHAQIHFLRVLINYVVESGLVDNPPIDLAELVANKPARAPHRTPSDDSEPLTVDELRTLLAVASPADCAAVHLLLCGVEMPEFLPLTCDEVDAAIDARLLRVTERWDRCATTREPHPDGAPSWPLTNAAVEALSAIRDQRRAVGTWGPGHWAFPGRPAARPMNPGSFRYRVRVLAQRAAAVLADQGDEAGAHRLAKVSPDVLRLTAAVIAGRGGASHLDIATQLRRTMTQVRNRYGLWLDPVRRTEPPRGS